MITKRTISSFDKYLDIQLDKMGSDYFPLSIKMERFKGIVLDFLRKSTIYIESTQEISEDIQTLFVRKHYTLKKDFLHNSIFKVKVPDELFRLSSIMPYYDEKSKGSNPLFSEHQVDIDGVFDNSYDNSHLKTNVRKLSIIKDGQESHYEISPYKKSTEEYPNVTRHREVYRINFGEKPKLDYNLVIISYIKNPKFGNIMNPNDILVDLPDTLVEQIISKTADAFRMQTGDESAGSNFQFNNTFGNRR